MKTHGLRPRISPFPGLRVVRVVNRTRSVVLAERVGVADRRWSRLRGYLGRGAPRPGEGILLAPCRSVHMMGMRHSLDVLFLDGGGRVAAVFPELLPWRWSPVVREARSALELPAGTIRRTGTRCGDLVEWNE